METQSTHPSALREGRYELAKRVGDGLPATYLGVDTVLAMPIVAAVAEAESDAGRALLHEARVAARLKGTGVAPVADVGVSDGFAWSVRAADGWTALTALAGLPNPEHLVALLPSVLVALDRARELGGVHRDIRPGTLEISDLGARLSGWGHTDLDGLDRRSLPSPLGQGT